MRKVKRKIVLKTLVHMFTNYQRVADHKYVTFCLLPGLLKITENLNVNFFSSTRAQQKFLHHKIRRQSKTLWALFSYFACTKTEGFLVPFYCFIDHFETWTIHDALRNVMQFRPWIRFTECKRIAVQKGWTQLYVRNARKMTFSWFQTKITLWLSKGYFFVAKCN